MSTLEAIAKHERLLTAAKTNLTYQKNRRWIGENYTMQPTALTPDITEIEQEITAHRRTLKELYQSI